MGRPPITSRQREWLIEEVRRLFDPAVMAPAPMQRVSDADIIKVLERLIERGRVALVLDDDSRPLRLEWVK